MNIVAVTSCAVGIAHTYMAAEKLEKAAKSLGYSIKIETQGAMGIENELTPDDITSADIAIFANDPAIERIERFDAIRKIIVPVQEAIKDPIRVLEMI
ncbi:MAG: PTS fructose transporter subunit IIB [Planctomycetes bacterium]|nr:PTS fructose transporter subunit IIB [Planctomycetota bacterium]